MLQAQAQLDQLVHGMITAINDTLCPNTTLGELTGNTASLTGTDENGNTVTITSGMKVLDTKNCSTGSDKQIPPQELFTRLGTERYTKVSVQETDANGNTVTNDYYVYNEESETDTSKQYTLASVSVNDKLVEQAVLEIDPVKQAELTSQAEQIFLDDAGIVPIFENSNTSAVQSYVEGFQMTAINSGYQFNHLVVRK